MIPGTSPGIVLRDKGLLRGTEMIGLLFARVPGWFDLISPTEEHKTIRFSRRAPCSAFPDVGASTSRSLFVRLYGCAEGVVRSPSWVAAFLPCGEDKTLA